VTAPQKQLGLLDVIAGPKSPANSTLPAGILGHLITRGILTETGLSRRARPRPCPNCGTWTIAGLDDDTCAFETYADPQPLTPIGEVLATLARRRTYELIHVGGRYELNPRSSRRITYAPAGTQARTDVLAIHRCGLAMPPTAIAPTSFAEAHVAHHAPGSEPPF
jgi:hypothetical protein